MPGPDHVAVAGGASDLMAFLAFDGDDVGGTELDDDVAYIGGSAELVSALYVDLRLETQPHGEGERELPELAR